VALRSGRIAVCVMYKPDAPAKNTQEDRYTIAHTVTNQRDGD